MDKFTWAHTTEPQGSITHRVLRSQFGDGYAQAVGDGINTKQQEWPLQFVGRKERIFAIRDFLDRQAGYKRFEWTPPAATAPIAVRAGGYQLQQAAGVFTLTVTFTESNKVAAP